MGIEPTLSAWEAEVLPLNYTRLIKAYLTEPLVALDYNNGRFLIQRPGSTKLPGAILNAVGGPEGAKYREVFRTNRRAALTAMDGGNADFAGAKIGHFFNQPSCKTGLGAFHSHHSGIHRIRVTACMAV
jgi:hypothetical protein